MDYLIPFFHMLTLGPYRWAIELHVVSECLCLFFIILVWTLSVRKF